MKIIDCFIFFNELNLLEFRLTLLDKHVDYFVIAELNFTFSGLPKPYYFEENRHRFSRWLHKITYLPVHQTTEEFDFTIKETSYNPQRAAFKMEYQQRNALSAAGSLAADNDLVLLGDLDEIPNPFLLKKLHMKNGPVSLSMLFHYYYFNCQHSGLERWWKGTIACTGKQFKQLTPQGLRDKRNHYKAQPRAGWHFSFLGGAEQIKNKIRSFSHTEFNTPEYLNDQNITQALEAGRDVFKRPGLTYKFVPVYYYPRFLQAAMKQYPALLYTKSNGNFLIRSYYFLKNFFQAL